MPFYDARPFVPFSSPFSATMTPAAPRLELCSTLYCYVFSFCFAMIIASAILSRGLVICYPSVLCLR